ncbi:MAG TPA: HDOD domain-containing protein [Methylophilaceae bacterium]|jgi:HD-like signal output (HDOD) protein|nr:HDOD domain-containing protein [Methylophilaceae bacterium]
MVQQPQDLAGWVTYLSSAELPVLKHTARELERMRADEDNLNARSVAHVVTSDPLMTVKLLRYLQEHKRSSQTQELVQVEQAIMMMGFNTFFREIRPEPLVEDVLHDHLPALTNLLRTVRRAQRASRYAFDWALLLHDLRAEEVRIAALLSYIAEMMMWCFSPEAMLKIRAMQDMDKTLRSTTVQQQVLGFQGMELQKALTTEWKLPGLLLTLMDPAHSKNERVCNVMLALNLARHSANGWDDAALPDDYRDIAALLRVEPEKVKAMVGASPSPSPSAA